MDNPGKLTPIPTPAAQRWRELRLIYLPRVTFLVAVIAGAILWTFGASATAVVAEAEIDEVKVRSPQTGVINNLAVALRQTVHTGDVLGQISTQPRVPNSGISAEGTKAAVLKAPMDSCHG